MSNVFEFPGPRGGYELPPLQRIGTVHHVDGQPLDVWVNEAGQVTVFAWPCDEALQEGIEVPDGLNPYMLPLDASEAKELAWLLSVAAGVATGVVDATGEVCHTFSPDRPPLIIEER
jgi:hypothetical protein